MKTSLFFTLFLIITLSFSCQNDNNQSSVPNCCGTPYLEEELGDGKLFIPNIFSPDNSGYNDVLYVHTNSSISLIKSFQVRNASNDLIFSVTDILPNDPQFGWNGAEINGGIYRGIYKVEVSAMNTEGEIGNYQLQVCSYPCHSGYPKEEAFAIEKCAFSFQNDGEGGYCPARGSIEDEGIGIYSCFE